jgi:hypothetical protein
MRIHTLSVLALACLVSAPASAQAEGGLTLNAKTVIIERPDAPGAVKKAIDDLPSDMQKTDQTVLFLRIVNECNLNNAQLEAAGVKEGNFSPSQPPDSLIPNVP